MTTCLPDSTRMPFLKCRQYAIFHQAVVNRDGQFTVLIYQHVSPTIQYFVPATFVRMYYRAVKTPVIKFVIRLGFNLTRYSRLTCNSVNELLFAKINKQCYCHVRLDEETSFQELLFHLITSSLPSNQNVRFRTSF